MGKKKIVIISVIVVFLAIILFVVLSSKSGKVESITLTYGTFEEKVLGVGRMEAGTENQIKAEVSGNILSSAFNEGSSLSPGDTIFVIDGSDQQFIVEEKKAAFETAKAEFQNLIAYQLPSANGKVVQTESDKNLAFSNYNDAKSLYSEGAISNNDLMAAENRYQTTLSLWNSAVLSYKSLSRSGSLYLQSQSQLESAKASYDMAKAQLEKYTIKSPGKAVLLKKYVDAGVYVQPGQSIADIGTLDNPYVSSELDERYFPYIKAGMPALIFIDNSNKFKASISSVSPQINDATGGFSIKIKPSESIPYKASNLTVNIEIVLISVPKALSLPEGYIVRDGSSSYVWLYKGGAVTKTKITADAALSGNVLVKSGLSEGNVVVKPQPAYVDGTRVSI